MCSSVRRVLEGLLRPGPGRIRGGSEQCARMRSAEVSAQCARTRVRCSLSRCIEAAAGPERGGGGRDARRVASAGTV